MSASGSSFVLAIDGPSGVGKSTVSRRVASALGLRYLDTGGIYRGLTWKVQAEGIDPTDVNAVTTAARSTAIVSGTDPDTPTITVDGVDVASQIRTAAVTSAVSAVSAIPSVRLVLVELQRDAIGSGGIVIEGRDIGTVVAPDADLKVFLTAHENVRARRRSGELPDPSRTALHEVRRELARRDAYDSGRAVSPLAKATDAVVVDTTDLGLDDVVRAVVDLAVARGAELVDV